MSAGGFGKGKGSIFLDNLKCSGNEQTLLKCSYSDTHNCDHSEDAGVRCQCRWSVFIAFQGSFMYFLRAAMCSHGEVRLVVGEDVDSFYEGLTDYNDAYYDKDGLKSGRVEVCVSGRYGSVCHNPWTEMDASVVCKQLGFSEYGRSKKIVSIANSTFPVHRCYQCEC